MANVELPRRKKSPGESAMLKARARAEQDRIQEHMEAFAAEVLQTETPYGHFGNCNRRGALPTDARGERWPSP